MLFDNLEIESQFNEKFPFGLGKWPSAEGYIPPNTERWAADAKWHCVGEFAQIHYRSGEERRLLMPYASYGSPRNYLESAWARGAVLNVRTMMGCMEFNASIPTNDISKVYWFYVYSTDPDYGSHEHAQRLNQAEAATQQEPVPPSAD
jgi:hypothetical protein